MHKLLLTKLTAFHERRHVGLITVSGTSLTDLPKSGTNAASFDFASGGRQLGIYLSASEASFGVSTDSCKPRALATNLFLKQQLGHS